MISSATVARGWSGYFRALLDAFNLHLPGWVTHIHVSDGISLVCRFLRIFIFMCN